MRLEKRNRMSLYDMLNERNRFNKGGIYYAQNSNQVPAGAPEEEARPTMSPIYSFTGITGAPTEFESPSWVAADPRREKFQNPLSYFNSKAFAPQNIVKPGTVDQQSFLKDPEGNILKDEQGNPVPQGYAMQTSYSLNPAEQIEGIQRASSRNLDAINFEAADLDDPEKREALLSSQFGQTFFDPNSSQSLSDQYQSYTKDISKFIDQRPQVIDQAISEIQNSNNPEHVKLASMLSKESTAEGKRNLLKKLATDGKIGYAHTILEKSEELSPTVGKINYGGEGTGTGAFSDPEGTRDLLVDMFYPQPSDRPRTREEYADLAKNLNLPSDKQVVVRVGNRNIPNEYFFDYLAEGVKRGVDFSDQNAATQFANDFMDQYGYVPSNMPSWVKPEHQMNVSGSGVGVGQEYLFGPQLMEYRNKAEMLDPNWRLENMIQQKLQQQRGYSIGGKIKINKGY